MKDLSVFVAYNFEPSELSYIQERLLPAINLSHGTSLPDSPDYEVLVHGRPDEQWLSVSSRLKMLVIPFAGLPESTASVLKEFSNLTVYNLHHNAVPVAEMAIGLLLATARRIAYLDRCLRKGDWSPRYSDHDRSFLLQGRSVLILGYGHVGRVVGKLCRGLGMAVKAVQRSPAHTEGDVDVYSIQSLPELLPWARVVIVCLPLTDETRGLLDGEMLGRLPRDAIIINVGRAGIIDERALYEALKNGSLAAAGLDVWFNYPATEEDRVNTSPSAYPFHQLDNVVMTPHIAGQVHSTEKLRLEQLADLLNRLALNQPPDSEIDIFRGY